MRTILAACAVALVTVSAHAQVNLDPAPRPSPAIDRTSVIEREPKPVQPQPPTSGTNARQVDGAETEAFLWHNLFKDDTQVLQAYKERLLIQWDRDKEILAERREAFAWQAWTTQFMFWIVHTFLIIACVAASMEFLAAYRKRKEVPDTADVLAQRTTRLAAAQAAQPQHAPQNNQPAPPLARGEPETELKLGMEGIALKTALHGLIILVMAMGFYFMYLKFVYPISDVGAK